MITTQDIQSRVAALPDFDDARVVIDREEISIIGTLSDEGCDGEAARSSRISHFRERTRDQRIDIAVDIERRTGRKVAWGARCGPTEVMFTHLGVPVMTRLKQPDRMVLDTLVAAGVARSRSDALAWCVRLVGRHESDWLTELREAMEAVRVVRERGPSS